MASFSNQFHPVSLKLWMTWLWIHFHLKEKNPTGFREEKYKKQIEVWVIFHMRSLSSYLKKIQKTCQFTVCLFKMLKSSEWTVFKEGVVFTWSETGITMTDQPDLKLSIQYATTGFLHKRMYVKKRIPCVKPRTPCLLQLGSCNKSNPPESGLFCINPQILQKQKTKHKTFLVQHKYI